MSLYVYFIQAGDGGPVKIGLAGDPENRRYGLQIGAYEELSLLAAIPGTAASERALHKRFKAGHIRGEWFRSDTPGLQKEISRAVQIEAENAVADGRRLCAHCGIRPVMPPRTRLCGAECEREKKRQTSARWKLVRKATFPVPPEDEGEGA